MTILQAFQMLKEVLLHFFIGIVGRLSSQGIILIISSFSTLNNWAFRRHKFVTNEVMAVYFRTREGAPVVLLINSPNCLILCKILYNL